MWMERARVAQRSGVNYVLAAYNHIEMQPLWTQVASLNSGKATVSWAHLSDRLLWTDTSARQ